ncbi:MAG: hypothetical protein J5722_10305, partial [Oscillospiraceae bacterium]|nr:hypothetical protein [Oscillospiraceae bacterium]
EGVTVNHDKKQIGRLLAGLTAAFGSLTVMPCSAVKASAHTEQTLIGYYGDITGDLTVDAADVGVLRYYLMYEGGQLTPENTEYADLDGSNVLDARDLTLLKRILLEKKDPRPLYQETEVPDEKELIPAPVQAVKPTLGSVGEQKILMVAVEFPDCKNERDYSREEIYDLAFGDENELSDAYPLESITAYYNRSSYGRLHLTGDVYKYTARFQLDTYADTSDMLVDEVLKALNDEINFRDYDRNEDLVLDTFLMALPPSANPEMDYYNPWWPCSYEYGGWSRYDNVKPGNICMGAWPFNDRSGFNSTWVHELGHAMGLPDYYYYENPIGDGDGLPGRAGFAMMDEAMGDMTAFDKLMYGWYAPDEVHIYTGGTQTFSLQSSQDAPGCIVIPREQDAEGFLTEFFILEYATDTGNNTLGFSGSFTYDMFNGGGIRILHCDAEVGIGKWGPEFCWNNYGLNYDTSNLRQRVLRIVDGSHGFFKENSSVDCAVQGFQWYDSNGYQTVDPGVTIEVGPIGGGYCTVTVQEGSSGNVWSDGSTKNPGSSTNTQWPWGGDWGSEWGNGWGSWNPFM